MECRQAKIKFIRKLRCEEEEQLIGRFKGLIEAMKDSLKNKTKKLSPLNMIAGKLGNNTVALIQTRIDLLMKETTIDGKTTCEYDKLFSLDWEESEPLEWSFIYPHPQAILGTNQALKILKNLKLTNESEDKVFIKGILKEAGIMHITEKVEITLVER